MFPHFAPSSCTALASSSAKADISVTSSSALFSNSSSLTFVGGVGLRPIVLCHYTFWVRVLKVVPLYVGAEAISAFVSAIGVFVSFTDNVFGTIFLSSNMIGTGEERDLGAGYPLLEGIRSPMDVKRLPVSRLPELCSEIRRYLVEVLSETPGHLAAGLGVVELTVALHYVYDAPQDKIVWDVGHQSYPHKLLTGRLQSFRTLRQWGGLGGFTHPQESPYDAFISGHASNSVSAALGLSVAGKLRGRGDCVVAVIGDGAMTGGLAFEGLNNASSQPNDLLVILNDNHISIDPIKGGLSHALVDLTTSKTYNEVRDFGYRGLKKLRLMNETRKQNLQRVHNSLKSLINDQPNMFDSFSIRYFGPTDGHDVVGLVEKLETIKDFKGPKLLHIKTEKGKGYKPAEEDAVIWHAPGKFDAKTGRRKESPALPDSPEKFQDVFGKTLLELAEADSGIVGITPAMISGSSFGFMQSVYPDRVFDVGIAEGHAVTFSAGLALGGVVPFCNIYSSFLQRGYDEVIHDVAMQKAPVILCLDRAGLVGNDGATHQGVYDIAYLRTVPGLTLMSPIDEKELRQMMYTAYKRVREVGPVVIRFPRGKGSEGHWRVPFEELEWGKGEVLKSGSELCIVSYGPMGAEVRKVIAGLDEAIAEKVGHVNLRFVKPLDEELLLSVGAGYRQVVTVEDGSLAGGMGSAVLELYSDRGVVTPVKRLGIPDEFVPHGDVEIQRAYVGIDAESIRETVTKLLGK